MITTTPLLTPLLAPPRRAAYSRSPVPELAASNFAVNGGSVYPGSGGAPRNLVQNELMWLPRVGIANAAVSARRSVCVSRVEARTKSLRFASSSANAAPMTALRIAGPFPAE